MIPRLHAEYWYNAAAYARSWGWSPDTRVAHLIPVIHNAGIVCAVHGPHSAGACLVLGTADLDVSLPLMASGASHPRPARTRALQGHRRGRRVRGRHRVGDAGDPLGHQGAASPVRRPGTTRTVVRAAIRHGRRAVPHHPSRRPPRGPRHHSRHPPFPDGRDQDPATRHRHRAPRRSRSASCAAAARTRCADTSTPPRTTPKPSRPTASTAPATSPRSARSTASGTSPSRAASRTSSTGAARRSAPRRWSCCCSATRGSRRPPSSPCRTRGSGSAPAPTSWSGRTAHHCRGPAALRRAAGGEVQMARTRRASRRSPPHSGREDGQEAPAGRDRREGRIRTRREPAASCRHLRHPRRHRRRNPVTAHRIGLVVPSSNVTVETEVPALLARHADARFPSTPAG